MKKFYAGRFDESIAALSNAERGNVLPTIYMLLVSHDAHEKLYGHHRNFALSFRNAEIFDF